MPASLCILHDSEDRLLARRIAADLGMHGISARADLGEMRAGDALLTRLAAGALTASAGLILLTPASGVAPWLTHDLPFARGEGLLGGWRLIVARQRVQTAPEPLADAPVVDLTDYDAGLAALVALLY